MAKQGNYVTVPSGSAPNPFSGISTALSDLSKMYTDKAKTEAALKRQDALDARALTHQQFTEDLALKKFAQDELAAKRAEEQRTITNKRAADANKRAEYAYKQQQRKDANQAIADNLVVTPSIESLNPLTRDRAAQVQKTIDAVKQRYESEVAALNTQRNFYDDQGKLTQDGQKALDKMLQGQEQSEQIRSTALEVLKDLDAKATANTYDETLRPFVNSLDTRYRTAEANALANLTVEEFVQSGIEELKRRGHQNPYSKEVQTDLETRAKKQGLRTASEYATAAADTAKAEYERKKDTFQLLKGLTTDKGAGKQSSKGVSPKEWREWLDSLDLGTSLGLTGDKDKAEAVFKELSKRPDLADVPISILQEAIMLSTSTTLGDRYVQNTAENIAKIAETAHGLYRGGPDYRTDLYKRIEDELRYESPPSREEFLRNRFQLPAASGRFEQYLGKGGLRISTAKLADPTQELISRLRAQRAAANRQTTAPAAAPTVRPINEVLGSLPSTLRPNVLRVLEAPPNQRAAALADLRAAYSKFPNADPKVFQELMSR